MRPNHRRGVDAISIAAEIINAVEHKIREEISPFETVLISIGSIRTSAGTTSYVIRF